MLATALGTIAAAMHVAAFLLYNKQMLKGQSTPNTATWTMWAVTTTLNCITYLIMSNDVIKSLLPIISSLMCIGTFLFALQKGKLGRLNVFDRFALAFGLIAVTVWWIFRNATAANMLLQIPIVISFIPTYLGVMRNPKLEKALPWFIWGSAYIFSLVTVVLRWQGQPQDLVYPLLCMISHTGVGLCTHRKTKNTSLLKE